MLSGTPEPSSKMKKGVALAACSPAKLSEFSSLHVWAMQFHSSAHFRCFSTIAPRPEVYLNHFSVIEMRCHLPSSAQVLVFSWSAVPAVTTPLEKGPVSADPVVVPLPLPVELPPAFEPPAPLPTLWKILTENKAKLIGKNIYVSLPGLEKTTKTIKDVTEKGLEIDAKLPGGGSAMVTKKPEELSITLITRLLRQATGKITPEMQMSFALFHAERNDFDRAFKELGRLNRAGVDVLDVATYVVKQEASKLKKGVRGNEQEQKVIEELIVSRGALLPQKVKDLSEDYCV